MTDFIHPGVVLIFGALLLPALPKNMRGPYSVLIATVGFFLTLIAEQGFYGYMSLFGMDISPLVRVDKLSLLFAYIFSFIGLIGIIYCYHIDDWIQQLAGLFYTGASVGVSFAADILSFYLFWEMLSFCAVLLIWSQRTKEATEAGYRYILVHVAGGLSLFAGIMIYISQTGSFQFDSFMSYSGELFWWLTLIGFILCAAVPPLHAWLPDAYPSATIYGSVFLNPFTTKAAVYALIRGFPGAEILIYLGSVMAVYGVIYALLENNLRRLLSYHIVSQVGYMVAGVGLGTITLGLNGSASHAFNHILYKCLLFMSAGAVIYATGKEKMTELGDFGKYAPLTAISFFVGAFSIAGFPLTNGFIGKSPIISAAGELKNAFAYIMLNVATCGTIISIICKMGYYTFFSEKKADYQVKEIPLNMKIAMLTTSALCILIGIFPQFFYNFLPYPIDYEPYTVQHILDTLGIFSFTGLVFAMFLKTLKPKSYINLDIDWFYRVGAKYSLKSLNKTVVPAEYGFINKIWRWLIDRIILPLSSKIMAYEDRKMNGIPTFMSNLAKTMSDGLAIFHTGKIQDYAFYMLSFIGLVLLIYLLF
ncbi:MULTISPECIES: Na(+)/H(+) antiporter subunit D [Thermodesulfovibrio]|uniref:NADH-ubiquinone/plastoquinone n=1 Tax=Thermodesulfovibrio yellowstonii (strain ATCC 51303 / DSM 11347 / YP87) TaxID=289376 RepID=B5YL25_THEYD|nr:MULTISPECIES: Na(+)/H(+) antiporter subunit D [Thermodesulfovibrio]ACI21010.1 NADH-ubiquinone/plastoquinone [Thermodesulfovibrio yellowstonii DSM 11347]MDI6864121.1 Na(+)/H(+) antiporter subunit D [Thermodesulfovibrio yellowstonii]